MGGREPYPLHPSYPEVVVIADDLTGAADTGVAFARAGLPTVVSLDGRAGACRVLAVDTDSRRAPPAEAAARAGAAARRFADASVLYKKVDSTLRGRVAVELAAVAAAVDARMVLAPAFPATGRTTVGGQQRVRGVPLSAAGVWLPTDGTPPRDVPSMLADGGLAAVTVDLGRVRAGADALYEELACLRRDAVAICDAETEDDLATVARAVAALPERVVWAGSGGLARHLPGVLNLVPTPAGPPAPPAAGPVLVVVGTPSPVSAEQAAALAERRGVRRVDVPGPALVERDADELARAADRIEDALAVGDAVLTISDGVVIGARDAGPSALAALASLAAPLLPRLGALVGTGGDTLRAVLVAAGVLTFALCGEVEPGVPVGVLHGDRSLPVVAKAGAFGDVGTLVRVLDALR